MDIFKSYVLSLDFWHFLGTVGGLCISLAYYKLSKGSWSHDDIVYNAINLIGGILLFISLLFHFNLGSFLIEIFWIWIAASSLLKKMQKDIVK